MAKIALITGGSTGIGRCLAEEFAKDGYDLILVARNEDRLKAAQETLMHDYNVKVKLLSADLEKPESVDLIIATFKDDLNNIEVLVNNAGFGLGNKEFVAAPLDVLDGMININVRTTVDLTHKVLPFMLKKGKGKVLNLSSTAGFGPGPYMAIYYATKAFVLSFSVAIAEEYKKKGVNISVLCPGPTYSGFFARAGTTHAHMNRIKRPMTAEAVARIGYRGLMKGKTIIVPGFVNYLTSLTIMPWSLRTKASSWLNRV